MKQFNLWLFAGLFAAVFTLSACGDDDTNEPPKEKVTAETLKGTWDGSIDHDYAQGYYQRWRIHFDGKKYTSWHTHLVAGSVNDSIQGLKTVGNKEEGTWEYTGGNLVLTPEKQWASYVITSLDPLKYTYYKYYPESMEAEQWYETPELIVKSGVEEDKQSSTNYYISSWQVLAINEQVLTVKINNNTFNLAKQ